jgi:hypothetical protein
MYVCMYMHACEGEYAHIFHKVWLSNIFKTIK